MEEQKVSTRAGACPQNGAVVGPQFITAFGKTEQEAKAKIEKKLRELAKKKREDIKLPCEGTCGTGECLLVATIDDKNGYHFYPATSPTKGDGYLCVYDGPLTAECVCTDVL